MACPRAFHHTVGFGRWPSPSRGRPRARRSSPTTARYLIHSWSVQSALAPIPVAGGEGRYFWDYDGQALPRLRRAARQPRARPPAPEARRRDQGAGRPPLHDRAQPSPTTSAPSSRASSPRCMPGDLNRTFFTNGGAEANENAVKLARWVTGRHKIDRALPLVPRRDRRRGHPDRRSAPLVRRARPSRARPHVRPVHVPLPGRPSRSVPGLLGRPAPRGDPHVRGAANGRGGDARDRDRDERDHRPARRLPAVDPRGLRPPRDPADPRRGDGGLGPHGPLVRAATTGTSSPTSSRPRRGSTRATSRSAR